MENPYVSCPQSCHTLPSSHRPPSHGLPWAAWPQPKHHCLEDAPCMLGAFRIPEVLNHSQGRNGGIPSTLSKRMQSVLKLSPAQGLLCVLADLGLILARNLMLCPNYTPEKDHLEKNPSLPLMPTITAPEASQVFQVLRGGGGAPVLNIPRQEAREIKTALHVLTSSAESLRGDPFPCFAVKAAAQ